MAGLSESPWGDASCREWLPSLLRQQSLEPQVGESGKPREQLAQTQTRQQPVGTFQKFIFGKRKYLSFPCSGKRSKGDIDNDWLTSFGAKTWRGRRGAPTDLLYVSILSQMFGQDFEAEVWSRFWSCFFCEIGQPFVPLCLLRCFSYLLYENVKSFVLYYVN